MRRRGPAWKPLVCLLAIAWLAALPVAAVAQQIQVATHADPAPAAVAAPVRALLADTGVRVTIGDATFDFWWIKALPLDGKPGEAPSWSHVEEGTLAGAVKLSNAHGDIRGRTIKPGVYTLRYGTQPADGNHLGVSPFREFLLLSPVADDTDPKPAGHEGAVELAKKTTGISHPAVWSLDPPVANADPGTLHTSELGHQGVVFEVPVARGSQPAGTLRFGVILVGVIEA